jgi:glycosyltransferase involved in cell wall biosynthesis
MNKIAAIVPALNEEETIGPVAKTLVDSRVFDEVIVISDGSRDRTAERARAAGAAVHELPEHPGRGGKGQALEHALTHTDAQMIAFFDADLIGLTAEHVRLLVDPVLAGKRAMNTGWRDRGPLWNFIQMHFMPLIGGERVMQRSIFEAIPDKYLRGFMIESALNYYCRANGLKYGGTMLKGLTMRKKFQKVGWPKALAEYASMYWQVAKAMVVVRLRTKDFRGHFIHDKHHDS